MRASSRSVAASKSSRLRARSIARSRLRQTISRSPGNRSGALISARSRSSNSDSCSGPFSAAKAWIAGARKQVIQSTPAGFRSSRMRAEVIIRLEAADRSLYVRHFNGPSGSRRSSLCGSFFARADHRVYEGHAFRVIFGEPFFHGLFVGEDFEVVDIADFLAGVDVDKDGHRSSP